MDKAGAVEQHVDGAELVRQGSDRAFIGYIQMTSGDQRLGERQQLVLGNVCGQHARSLGGESQCRRPADPLSGRRHQSALAVEPSRHQVKLPCSLRGCKSAKTAKG